MFSAATEQAVYFTVQLPHSYKVGFTLYPHVDRTTASGTPSGTNVVWGLEYTVVAIGGSFPNTTTLTSNSVIPLILTPTSTGQYLITPLGTISGTNLGISTVLVCRLYRAGKNVVDTFFNAVEFLEYETRKNV